ncbi:hypothetical protein [Halodurantibacterium flavum]|uniref:Uncharacterized protein n=1 Tax=Halodurantibacterium flavum TaxID=1382802 RepID=A0ABW4S655_9RHOB
MKAFLAAIVFCTAVFAITGWVYAAASVSSTDRYSTRSAMPDHRAPVDGRLGWFQAEAAPR